MKGGQVEMADRWSEQLVVDETVVSEVDGAGPFCPECGQSLDLARHAKAPVQRRTMEPFVFLIFGLCLTVAFGIRAWNTHREFSGIDQQIAALRVQTLTLKVDDTLGEVLEQQAALRIGFQRDVTGLVFGLLTVIVGAVSWLHERSEVGDGHRNRMGSQHLVSSDRRQGGGSTRTLGLLLATTLVRMILLLFVIVVGLQLIRGVPPSLQLLDQALTRTITVINGIVAALS